MELTPIQKDILIALINLQRQKDRAVKGEEIAGLISRNPGTVRNQMQSLKILGLVEGVPGPKGGYKATGGAYNALNISTMENEAIVPIYKNNKLIKDATAAEISFTTIRHPDLCNSAVRILGNIRHFVQGDLIQIGPTPVNHLIVRGEIIGRDDSQNSLLFSITEMVSLPQKSVKHYIKKVATLVSVNANIQEAARVFVRNNVHGAPVEEKGTIVGIVTFTDIGNALANGRTTLKVRDIMAKDLITIDGEALLYEAVKKFNKYNIGRLVVTVDGVPKGVLSKTDVLNELAVY
ncbi:MAG TPA: CBS domain-containing protein [Methanosarcinaceae archaeon]|nr:CBS domain-containing protein [Methanosarcinaceae archaeon]